MTQHFFCESGIGWSRIKISFFKKVENWYKFQPSENFFLHRYIQFWKAEIMFMSKSSKVWNNVISKNSWDCISKTLQVLVVSMYLLFKVSREERRLDIKYEMGREKLRRREYQTILSVSDISVGWVGRQHKWAELEIGERTN